MKLIRLLVLPVAVIFAASSVIYAYADEQDAENNNSDQQVSDTADIDLADGGKYDRDKGCFRYYVPQGQLAVSSSVCDGMVTTDQVSLECDNGLEVSLFRNGELVENADMNNIKDPGGYTLVAYGTDIKHQLLSFTILPPKTGELKTLTLPAGFRLTQLIRAGTMQEMPQTGSVDLSQDGDYIIRYCCEQTGKSYELKVEIDHTMPQISFEGLGDENSVRGAVKVTGLETQDSIDVKMNGQDMQFPSDGVLSEPGIYKVSVRDDAGNELVREFEIKLYLNSQGLWFAGVFIAIIASVAAYMIWVRKNLRVR